MLIRYNQNRLCVCCLCDICLLTVMLACFYICIDFRYLLVGKIAVMANVDYVCCISKTDFKGRFLLFQLYRNFANLFSNCR